MKAAGLSYVRLPFGAWCIDGPRRGEPFVGPCLEALDQALDMLEAEGLRVLLDLHGCVGGESGDKPCGHEDAMWKPENWDQAASLKVLQKVAKRYAGRLCVCGLEVCNEPAKILPADRLAKYYERAITTIRQAGMPAGEVVVVLPIHTEHRKEEFLDLWEQNYLEYEDCAFDVHLYQCFGAGWGMLSEEQHLKSAKNREDLLRSLPACLVGEWSLCLPRQVTEDLDQERLSTLMERFAAAQLEAYEHATHGWFFWSWKDAAGTAWSMSESLEKNLLQVPRGGRRTDVVQP